MIIKEINAEKILDSRGEESISVFVRTEQGSFSASSPSGKSKGKHEAASFIESISHDISVLRNFKVGFDFRKFEDLIKIEELIRGKIGANSLYALEASLLKAAAYEQNLPLWKFLNEKAEKFPFPVANIIGGGLHTALTGGKRTDFQEFLIIPKGKRVSDNFFIMKKAHELAGNILKLRGAKGGLNDEGAWATSLETEGCLSVLNQVREELARELDMEIDIGIDAAASSFFKLNYNYKNPVRHLKSREQVRYISELIEKFRLSYVEDPLQEEDFSGFRALRERIKRPCIVVGDDLTTSSLERFKEALKEKSIGGIILKPNQIGSLIEINRIVGFCKKLGIATIISHRSGETMDYTIADLAFAWQCNFLKTSVMGKEREIKWKRLIEIEKSFESG